MINILSIRQTDTKIIILNIYKYSKTILLLYRISLLELFNERILNKLGTKLVIKGCNKEILKDINTFSLNIFAYFDKLR